MRYDVSEFVSETVTEAVYTAHFAGKVNKVFAYLVGQCLTKHAAFTLLDADFDYLDNDVYNAVVESLDGFYPS